MRANNFLVELIEHNQIIFDVIFDFILCCSRKLYKDEA